MKVMKQQKGRMDKELQEESLKETSLAARSITIQSQPRGSVFWDAAPSCAGMGLYTAKQLPWLHPPWISSLMCMLPAHSLAQTVTHSALSLTDKHTHTRHMAFVIYLEVGRLCLVHSEPHENSKLKVIGERLSARWRIHSCFSVRIFNRSLVLLQNKPQCTVVLRIKRV